MLRMHAGSPLDLVLPETLRWKVAEPLLLLGKQRFANVDIRVRVKGGGHVSQIYGERGACQQWPSPEVGPPVAQQQQASLRMHAIEAIICRAHRHAKLCFNQHYGCVYLQPSARPSRSRWSPSTRNVS